MVIVMCKVLDHHNLTPPNDDCVSVCYVDVYIMVVYWIRLWESKNTEREWERGDRFSRMREMTGWYSI